MKLDLDDLYIRIIPDLKVNEMIAPCENGYSVYIKEELPEEKKMEALYHAYMHKQGNDFSKLDIQSIESNAHGNIRSLAEFKEALKESNKNYEC